MSLNLLNSMKHLGKTLMIGLHDQLRVSNDCEHLTDIKILKWTLYT